MCLITQYGLKDIQHGTPVIGSFPGAVPPLIGWVAIEGQISLTAIALFFSCILLATNSFLCLSY